MGGAILSDSVQESVKVVKIPNFYIDEVMPVLTASEWKILIYILLSNGGSPYRLIGLTFDAFKEGTGIKHNATIRKALDRLTEVGLIIADTTDRSPATPTLYGLSDTVEWPLPARVDPPQVRPAPEYKPKSFNIPPNKRDEAPGFIYLMRDTVHRQYYKIGLSRKPRNRARQIGQVDLIHAIPTDNMLKAEREFHGHFARRRMEGEWFRLTDKEVELFTRTTSYNIKTATFTLDEEVK
jgi:hypothetical protein